MGGGDREGKALFSPFEVSKMPGRPFRTKKSVSTNFVHVFILSFYLKPCDYNWILLFLGKKYMLIKSVTTKHHQVMLSINKPLQKTDSKTRANPPCSVA